MMKSDFFSFWILRWGSQGGVRLGPHGLFTSWTLKAQGIEWRISSRLGQCKSADESSPAGNDRPLCCISCLRLSSAGTGAPGRSQTVKAASLVLFGDIITPLVWNDRQPLPEDESSLEVEKQETFPGQERAMDFQGTFVQYRAKRWPTYLTGSQDCSGLLQVCWSDPGPPN